MYHILQKCGKFIIRILIMVTDDYSIQLARSSLYYYCIARKRVRERFAQGVWTKSLKVAKVINLDKFLVDNLDKTDARCARECTFYPKKCWGDGFLIWGIGNGSLACHM